jgi:hypothetical protein
MFIKFVVSSGLVGAVVVARKSTTFAFIFAVYVGAEDCCGHVLTAY